MSHFGTDNHGHFVCEALDQEAECWWMCDDENVTKIDRLVRPEKSGMEDGREDEGPPAKRPKSDQSYELLKSRDAYMLVYSHQTAQKPIQPPEEVMRKVREDDEKWIKELGDHERRKLILEEEYDSFTLAKRQVAALLDGSDRLLPSTELERWFNASSVADLFGPWTIPTCRHGAIDPERTRDFKLVSQAAFDLLRDYCTSKIPVTKDSLTGAPIAKEERVNGVGSGSDSKGNQNGIANGNGNSNGNSHGASVDKGKGKESSHSFSPPSNSTATCYASLPELPICQECVAEIYSEKAVPSIELTQAEKLSWQNEIKRDRALIKNSLNKLPQVFGIDYYYLPSTFVLAWLDYVSKPMTPKPQLGFELDRCKHDLLDVDLGMDRAHYITAYGWDTLTEM